MTIKMILSAVGACAVLTTASIAWAADPMTEAQCTELFTKNDVNNDGSLGPKEGDTFQLKMTPSGDSTKKDATGIIQKDAFMSECMKGTFNL